MWLCTCGIGSLSQDETPPEFCPLCGFPLLDYFTPDDQDTIGEVNDVTNPTTSTTNGSSDNM